MFASQQLSEYPAFGLTMEQLRELHLNCIQIAAENKITVKNTWNFAMIDHLNELVKLSSTNNNRPNFQKVSCTLDAVIKIYACRVDSIHSEAVNLVGGISYRTKTDFEDFSINTGNKKINGTKSVFKHFSYEATLAHPRKLILAEQNIFSNDFFLFKDIFNPTDDSKNNFQSELRKSLSNLENRITNAVKIEKLGSKEIEFAIRPAYHEETRMSELIETLMALIYGPNVLQKKFTKISIKNIQEVLDTLHVSWSNLNVDITRIPQPGNVSKSLHVSFFSTLLLRQYLSKQTTSISSRNS
jgi:hypothetical protein